MNYRLLELADPLARRVAMALDDVLTVDAVKLDFCATDFKGEYDRLVVKNGKLSAIVMGGK